MNKKGFTLVEVLATIVLLSILLMIAVPSVTTLQEKSNIKQIEADAKVFIELVRQKIESDTSINISVSYEFKLEDIDITKLSSSNYDKTNSKVTASECGYNSSTDVYTCNKFEVVLENDSYKASGDTNDITGSKK